MWSQGLLTSAIARTLGRSSGAIRCMRVRLDLPDRIESSRPWTKAEDSLIRRHFKEGITTGTTAAALKRTHNQVKWRRYRLGLKLPPDVLKPISEGEVF